MMICEWSQVVYYDGEEFLGSGVGFLWPVGMGECVGIDSLEVAAGSECVGQHAWQASSGTLALCVLN